MKLGRKFYMADVDHDVGNWDRAWFTAGASSGFAILMAAWLSPLLSVSPRVGFALGFVVLSGLALWVSGLCGQRGRGRLMPWVAASSLLFLVAMAVARWHGSWQAPMVGSALLWLGSYVGMSLGQRIEHAGHLLFVAWVSAVVDLVSVLHPGGVTHAIARSEVALSVLALPFPLLGTPDVVPMLGVGDVVFMALYVAAARRHSLPIGRTLVGLMLGLILTLAALLWFEVTIPALPLLGVGVVLAEPAARRPPQKQRRAAVVFASTLSVLAAAVLLGNAGR